MTGSKSFRGGSGARILCLCGVVLAVLLTACAEGYATDDEPLVLSSDMTRQQALEAMNRIGAQGYLSHEWDFELNAGCVLVIDAQRRFSNRPTVTVPLGMSQVTMVRDETDTRFDVVVRPVNMSALQTTVIEGATWPDAAQMKWLLDYIPRHCDAKTTSAAVPGSVSDAMPQRSAYFTRWMSL